MTPIYFGLIMVAKLTVNIFLRVVRMSTKRLYLVILALVIGCQSPIIGSVARETSFAAKESSEKVELDPQLELNKRVLLEKTSSDQMRINAATVMLLSENPPARQILLDALKQTENDAVRKAVCKALIQARTGQETLNNVDDFVQPLLGVLVADNSATAKLAAEATLIFDYEHISEPLEQLIANSSLPLEARLNAIYALELHPDMRAAITLLTLVDSPEEDLAAEAEKALLTLGIPAGTDTKTRKQIVRNLVREGPVAFLRARLIRKEAQIRGAKSELALWQGRYLLALDNVYAAIGDDAEKAKFLTEHLSGFEAIVRLWTLEKIRQDRVGTRPNPKLPAEVGPVLVNLVSDQNRDVRLKTAAVLSFMTEVDSARDLLTQLEAEQDDQVKTQLFSALGSACYIAFLPNSKIKIPPEIRKQTLEWAVKYLAEQTPAKAQKGAEVMKKLLEQDGLTSAETDRYLSLLAQRYHGLKNGSDGPLRGELLSALAGLCAPQSVHKAQSKKRFGPLFEAALTDKTDFVREAAVDGLIYIDKAAALKRLRKDFVNDPSAIIRKKLIALAGDVGGKEDLLWLAGKIGSNSESEPAWQAMLKIFNGSDSAALNDWVSTFAPENSSTQASDAQKITFLELAERKAVAENKPKMLKDVREKLAELYIKTGLFERAADYLGRLHEAASTIEEKKVILPDLLNAYLRWPKIELAAKLIENSLLREDLDPNDVLVRSLDDYLTEPPLGADANAVLGVLTEIKTPEARPLWRERLRQWTIRLGKAMMPGKSEQDGT